MSTTSNKESKELPNEKWLREKLAQKIWVVVPDGVDPREAILDGVVEVVKEYRGSDE